MCFVVHTDYPNPQIAEEDMECFKKGTLSWSDTFNPRQVFISLFQGHIYRFQEPQPKIKLNSEGGFILEGYHSYTPEHNLVRLPICCLAFTLVRCIIPKGSTYYYNPDTCEYVSSSLMVLEIIR